MKTVPQLSVQEAAALIKEGSSLMVGGFGMTGNPVHLLHALAEREVGGFTYIANNVGEPGLEDGRVLILQFGGAVGTLASLADKGIALQEKLAMNLGLGLGLALMPWHTQRDSFAELANWLSLVTSSLAKMAQDIILLTQSEVGELQESNDPSRGGSSTLPQKSNPVQSELIITAARQNAQLLASMHNAMIQEHERGTHGWQLEWLALPQMFHLSASALKKALWLSQNMIVNTDAMLANVKASKGIMLAEYYSFELAKYMPRVEAKALVKQALMKQRSSARHLADELADLTSNSMDWSRKKRGS